MNFPKTRQKKNSKCENSYIKWTDIKKHILEGTARLNVTYKLFYTKSQVSERINRLIFNIKRKEEYNDNK